VPDRDTMAVVDSPGIVFYYLGAYRVGGPAPVNWSAGSDALGLGIGDKLLQLVQFQRAYRRRIRDERERRRLLSSTTTCFTRDWGESLREPWTQHLGHLSGREDVQLLEIGSWEGFSALWLLQNIATHPTSHLTCVDPFVDEFTYPRFEHNLTVSGVRERVTLHRDCSENVLPSLPWATFDAIYVDGSHDSLHVLLDTVISWRLLKAGGVMILDDYLWRPELPAVQRPQLAVDAFMELVASTVEVLHKDYQVILRKRTSGE
jgi:predicted O-methyltransferase YrrM